MTAEFALTRLFRSLPLRSAVATYAELERTCPSTEITSKHPANRKSAATLCILQFQHHTIVDSRNLFHSHIRIEHQTKTVVVSRGSGQRNSHYPRSQIGWRLEARHLRRRQKMSALVKESQIRRRAGYGAETMHRYRNRSPFQLHIRN